MPKTCGDCCCDASCNSPECNCRCGESTICGGVFVFFAACIFWICGELCGASPDGAYHKFNIFWFEVAVVCWVLGAIYAVYARGKQAFAREHVGEDEEKGEAAEVQAPAPYIMLGE